MLIRCECGWEMEVPENLSGKMAQCPKCKSQFVIAPAPVAVMAATSPVPAETDTTPESFDFQTDELDDDEEGLLPLSEMRPAAGNPPSMRWAGGGLGPMREKLSGYFPWVCRASWALRVYAGVSYIMAVICILGVATALFVGGAVAGTTLAGAENRLGGVAAGIFIMSYSLPMLLMAYWMYLFGSLSGAASEILPSWAASKVDENIYPGA